MVAEVPVVGLLYGLIYVISFLFKKEFQMLGDILTFLAQKAFI